MIDQHKKPNPDAESFVIDTEDARLSELATQPIEVFPPPKRRAIKTPSDLNEYSRRFYDQLVRAFPDWAALVMVLSGHNSDGALFLEVASPSSELMSLWISTQEERVSVGFGRFYHAHFATYPPNTDSEMFRRALEFVTDFLTEKIVVAVAISAGRPGRSWVVRSGDEIKCRVPDNSMFPVPDYSMFPPDQIRVFSWKSTHDREIAV